MSAETKTCERVAAFFDLDGTLIPEPSLERRFFSELRHSGAILFANYLRWGVEALRLLPKGLLAVQHGNKRYLAGVSSDLVFKHVGSISFFEEGLARVAWHARRGHNVVLVTGALEPLACLAAMALECELEVRGVRIRPRVCATQLAEDRGRWTGHLVGDAAYGPAKARVIRELAKEGMIDLRQCHAYGNSLLDRPLLCAVGHGHAVNPGKELAALANEKDWPIWHWHQEKKVDSNSNTRLAEEIQHIEGKA
jgi:HAD superfamily phosphoserine phosphatase-like hydrolase